MDPPIAGQFFNTFNDLFAAVQSHARQTGWAVVKTRASNRRADGNYYKYDLACDRGVDTHEMRSTGRRQASSRKEGCPWRGVAAARKSNGDRWKYETINSTHNHPPSLDASVHSMHRRLTDEERGALERHTQAGSRLHVITSDLRAKNQALKKRDILNERAKLQRQAAGPYTQTQRFIQVLQESGEFYRLCRDADDRIIGVFWTFPWCREMAKAYPDVISMDNTYNVCPFLPFFNLLANGFSRLTGSKCRYSKSPERRLAKRSSLSHSALPVPSLEKRSRGSPANSETCSMK